MAVNTSLANAPMQYYLSPIQPEPRFVLTNKEASSMDRNLHTARLLQCPLLTCAERRLGLNHSLSPCIQNLTTRRQLIFTNTSHAHAIKNTSVKTCCKNVLCSVRRSQSTQTKICPDKQRYTKCEQKTFNHCF